MTEIGKKKKSDIEILLRSDAIEDLILDVFQHFHPQKIMNRKEHFFLPGGSTS